MNKDLFFNQGNLKNCWHSSTISIKINTTIVLGHAGKDKNNKKQIAFFWSVFVDVKKTKVKKNKK